MKPYFLRSKDRVVVTTEPTSYFLNLRLKVQTLQECKAKTCENTLCDHSL